jgi:hypothetical protein
MQLGTEARDPRLDRRAPPFVHASERRRLSASDACSGRAPSVRVRRSRAIARCAKRALQKAGARRGSARRGVAEPRGSESVVMLSRGACSSSVARACQEPLGTPASVVMRERRGVRLTARTGRFIGRVLRDTGRSRRLEDVHAAAGVSVGVPARVVRAAHRWSRSARVVITLGTEAVVSARRPAASALLVDVNQR